MTGVAYEHSVENPIINSPFEEPKQHWHVRDGQRPDLKKGRRIAGFYQREMEGHARFSVHSLDPEIYQADADSSLVEFRIVTAIRKAIADWRDSGYEDATPITKDLLAHWRSEDRRANTRLFFAQIEAAETIIFLREAPPKYQRGIVERIPIDMPSKVSVKMGVQAFRRYACKMATGTGKTTVMGMLSAWSILNAGRYPDDERFSDTILTICPNVTIRGRLRELDPRLGSGNIYRTRDLVQKKFMDNLMNGTVMIANWHRLALKPSNGGLPGKKSSRVIRAGIYNEHTGVWEESPEEWLNRIRRELGGVNGRSAKWLIFNDEAHHAYRRDDTEEEVSEIGDTNIEKEFRRQATIWIEGVDRINKHASGDNSEGITMCVDMSATPFYLSNSGNDVGKPFPWIVSDFGLLDAIESGMTKIPQLPSQDQTGALEAAYFNIWRWVQERAQAEGYTKKISNNPDIIVKHASQPISLLAAEWKETFDKWRTISEKMNEEFVPPIFIVVCSNVKIAKAVHEWIADNDTMPWFRNEPGREVTVRIDSSRMKDIDAGTGKNHKDPSKRLRYILDTAGKKDWPGGKVPEEWRDIVIRHNRDAEEDDTLHRLSESPPGRHIRCIVSVSMLTEGWDANTVTHIVGLRPFSSQLLCEQVTGRALRRKSYAFDDKGMLAEEVATICGVPFELVPFKTNAPHEVEDGPREMHYIEADDEKREFRIEIPDVSGFTYAKGFELNIDWERMHQVTIDPFKTPSEVDFHPNLAHEGGLAKNSPGKKERVSIEKWRSMHRRQSIAFMLAHRVCERWRKEMGDHAVPLHVLFPKVAQVAIRFLNEKVVTGGGSDPRDILASENYATKAVQSIFGAMHNSANIDAFEERATVIRILSTDDVGFHTARNVWEPVHKCHLNKMVADTEQWEQSAAYHLDNHPRVTRWTKTDGTSFEIEYRLGETKSRYRPDFVAVTDSGLNLVVEIKGAAINDDITDAKAKAAERWARAVTAEGNHGRWEYLLIGNPNDLPRRINEVLG